MWPASSHGDGSSATSSAVQQPAAARTHIPFRAHEEPQSMGEDAYLRPTTAASSRSAHSSTAPLATGAAQPGRRSSFATDSSAAAATGGAGGDSDDDDDDTYKAGVPIGLLAAIGTPMAKKPIWRSRKCQILCPILGIITLLVSILILVFPVLRAVAIHTLSTSVLDISTSNITKASNESFTLTLEGQARKVGIFPARLYFERPVNVFWIAPENVEEEIQLGHFALEPIGVAAGHGRIKQLTEFVIDDLPGFSRFTEYLITQESFTWRLKSESVQAKAFGFIAANKLDFVKDLTLPGMANMTDVSITDFQLPGDDPAGGISLSVQTQFTNPSAFGVEIGILTVGLWYEDLFLGPAQTASAVNLTAGVNNLHLVGRLVPYTNDPAALEKLSVVFSRYLNGESTPVQARGLTVNLPSGENISWLSAGIKALTLNVPLISPTGRISPITGIDIKALSLEFDSAQPYAPMANSSQVTAGFGLPFGFSLDIVELANSFAIVDNRTSVASLSAPLGMSNTTLLTRNAGYTTGSIDLDLPLAPLTIGPSYTEHLTFDQFTYDLTTTNGSTFVLVGNTTAITNTPLGQVKLDGIGFTVPAGLIGLESLATNPTLIQSVDVVGGTPDAILLNIVVGLTNPSNLDLEVGNVTFQLFAGDSFLGTAVLPDLHLTTGFQEHNSVSYFQANSNNGSLATLNDFVAGKDTDLKISGFNGSTATDSLTQAFMALHLNATLPGLGTKLLDYANLTVLSTTGRANNMADSLVSLNNPFTTDLMITNIQSNITAFGLFVGSIVQNTDFAASGKAKSISPTLGLDLNLYPPDIFGLLRALVVDAGMPTEQLDGIVALGGYTLTPSTPNPTSRRAKRSLVGGIQAFDGFSGLEGTSALGNETDLVFDKRGLQKRNIYTGFDLPSFVLEAFSGLEVGVDLLTKLNIGQYETALTYTQLGVPAYTDSSLTLLLPVLAQPIVQKIVDEAILSVTTVLISNPSNTAFTTGLVGAITNSGPFDAVITFTQGLTIGWNGQPLGQIAMPNVSLVGDEGAQLDLNAEFAVADLDHLTEFTGYLLTQPSFAWQIYGEGLSISALGITVDGISIMKDVVLDGMNGFKDLVTINAFDLPSNDPAGGISLTLQTSLTNPSSVGVALSQISFFNTFGATTIGPAASTAAFDLLPKATIQLPLAGRLVPQSSPEGLAAVSTIFNGFVHGVPSDLVVHGESAGPSDCVWLNEGIKQLAIAVVLPAAQNLEVINSITINTLSLFFTEDQPWAPSFSTDDTVAKFQLPFAFPVDIQQIATGITAGTTGGSAGSSRLAKRAEGDFATLNVPLGPAKTDVVARTLFLAFSNVPFTSVDNSAFSSFLTSTTDGSSVSMDLHGAADTVAATAVGLLNLDAIAFSVDTSLLGLQGLNAKPATVSDLDVFHGYSDYLQINVNAALYNPSNITIGTGDVAFGLSFQSQIIGTADITALVLAPGDNKVPTAVHYQPSGGAAQAAGQVLLENYVQGIASDTLIVGTDDTTPIASLKEALKTIQLATTIPPLEQLLVTQANLDFPIDVSTTGIAEATFSLDNPFTASINLVDVTANASFQGIGLGQIKVKNLNPTISAAGHEAIVSRTLPFDLNIDPKALIEFIEAAAASQGVDLGILLPEFAYVLGLDSTASSIVTTVNSQPESCAPTGTTAAVKALILAAVKNLRTNLTLESVVRLDDYQTPLNFVQNNVPTVLSDDVFNLVGAIGKTIVSNIIDVAELSFSSGQVTNVTNNGFTVALTGSLLNAGPFDALIEFPEGVDVIWQGNKIATISLPPICSAGGSGVPTLQTTGILTIANKGRFTDFATYILLNPGFTWTITTDKLRVLALGTIFDNAVLTKDVSFSAFNGLPGVTIVNPDFPGDSQSPKGIQLVTDTSIPSPSNLGIELGRATFEAKFEGELVGPIVANGLTLAPLAITTTQLTGTIVERTSSASTTSLGHLFSGFLAGENQTLAVSGKEVVSPAQPDSPVDWLSTAFKKLTLQVVLPGHTYDIISSIQLQDLTITITEQSEAYSVPSQNNETDVVYKNPFGFSLTAKQAGGDFYINYKDVDTALLTLPVADAVRAETSTGQDAALVLDFKEKRILQSLDNTAFGVFFNDITNTAGVTFNLHGAANVTAATNAGDIPITGIPFSVETSLLGIQSLNAEPTVVSNLDVFRGYPDYLQINADASLFNPSNLTIITNEVTFGLEFASQIIGSVLIGDLLLIPGENNLGTEVRYAPTGGASTAAGQVLLENYIQGIDSDVNIAGTDSTTPYGSLQPALSTIKIATTIPAIHQLLITRAALSFPLDIGEPGVTADATFDLSNPFTASINLLGVVANATYQTFYLGQINQPSLDPVISAGGHKNITSRKLPFTLTTDPKFLIQFLEAAATAQGVDLGILLPEFAYVLGLPSTDSEVTTAVNTKAETCAPTGTTKQVAGLILAAVANLRTDLTITTTTKLDEYQTDLAFVQEDVPTELDQSVLYLTGIIGKTIVSHIVDEATLAFSGGTVTNVTDNGFTVALKGSLLNAGPFDALIEFPQGVDVIFEGANIANIILPAICSPGGASVPDLETTGILQITDLDAFTSFTAYLLNNPSFTWTITTDALRVYALGTIFDNVTLTKNITFDAFNKLAPGVTVSNPDFPGDSSSPPGIKLSLDSLIPSPSNLGITLGDVSFIASYQGQEIGPVTGQDLTLPPKSTTALPLTGTIIYRDDQAGVDALGEVFSQFLAGENVPLTVRGDSVVSPAQPGSPVNWLSAAFKELVLNVSLPGEKYQIIYDITLKDLTVTLEQSSQDYAALVQNNETDVTFKNPFGFSLKPIQAGGNFIINYGGTDAGVLLVPIQNVVRSDASTGQEADLVIQILEAATFQSLDNGAYQNFFSAITNQANVDFGLHGGANVTAQTAAGNIPISGIPFDVQTAFEGIAGFGGKATIPETPVVLGGGGGDPFGDTSGSDFLRISLTTILDNPAPLILHTNQVSFEVLYKSALVGRAYVDPLDLLEGTNTLPTEFHYMPADASDATAQDLLAQYLETKDQIPLTIKGDSSSSPYGSLQTALSGVTLETSFPGQGIPLVSDIVIYFDLVEGLCNSTVSIETRLDNNLETSIQLLQLAGTASQNGVQYAEFDFTFTEDFVTGAGENPGPYSQMISPVKLSAGPLASLTLLATSGQGLDIEITSRVSIGGYVAPSLQYSQKAVPYTIVPTAGGAVLDLGSIGSDPIGTLTGLLTSLTQITQCVGGVLTLLPGLGLSLITGLPGFLTSLIQAPPVVSSVISDVSSIVSGVTSLAGSVVSDVTSIAGSVVSDVTSVVGDVTSVAGSVVSEVTSVAGSVVGDITSALPAAATVVSEVTSVVGDVTSAAAAVPSAAESVVDQATSVVGEAACTLLPALCAAQSAARLARRNEISPPTPTAHHPHGRPISTGTPVLEALIPPPSPTAAPLQPVPFDWLSNTAAQAGADPLALQQVLSEHGVTQVVEIGEWRRRRDERERLKKREKREKREQKDIGA